MSNERNYAEVQGYKELLEKTTIRLIDLEKPLNKLEQHLTTVYILLEYIDMKECVLEPAFETFSEYGTRISLSYVLEDLRTALEKALSDSETIARLWDRMLEQRRERFRAMEQQTDIAADNSFIG